MRLPRVRFTMRRVMILVALIAFNLAGISSTLKAWPRIRHIHGGRIDSILMDDGSILVRDPLRPGSRPTPFKGPSLSGFCRVWGPMALSSGVTILAVGAAFVRRRRTRNDRACL